MATPNRPFNPPFAQNGDREQVGATSDDNSVNYNEGYTLPYEKPPQDGGKDIERKKLNQILYDFTSKLNDLSQEIDKWINLTTEDLNNVKERGNYFQNLTQQATTANNYPINQAGYLLVFNNSINSWGVTQIYKIYNSDKFYIRRTTSATAWSAWDSLVLTSEMIPTINNAVSNKEDKTKLTFAPINSANNLNANNLTSGGMYWITTKSGSNLPTTNGAFLEVVSNNEQVRQNFYPDVIRNEAMYFRTRDAGGTWSNWNSVLTADYTKSLVLSMIPMPFSRSNYTPANIANATFPIPNSEKVSGVCILVTARWSNAGWRSTSKATFTFKVGDTTLGNIVCEVVTNRYYDDDVTTKYAIMQQYFPIAAEQRGQTIIPSVVQNNGTLSTISFIVLWQ